MRSPLVIHQETPFLLLEYWLHVQQLFSNIPFFFVCPKRVFNRVLSLYFKCKMTTKQKDNKELIILKNIVPFLYSIYLFISQSVQYHFKILPSGQSSLLMSFFERLQIGQSWWEDYDLPDGTLCVLLFWQSDPTEYWDERPAWISWKKKCEISWSECTA